MESLSAMRSLPTTTTRSLPTTSPFVSIPAGSKPSGDPLARAWGQPAATFVQAASPHLQPFVARPQDLPSL